MRRSNAPFAVAALVTLGSCARDPSPPSTSEAGAPSSAPASTPADAEWLLKGSSDERFARVAKHPRGFDMAMVETGYRYVELYWAGQDRNWGYAAYQLGKIETAVTNGVERRPRRAASAQMLGVVVGQLRQDITQRDAARFDPAFASLTDVCNACHQAERVPFIRVKPPTVRTSPVHGPEAAP